MTKVFVTGAEGFIGSHLVEKLVREGYQVRALSYYIFDGRFGWLDSLSKDILSEIEIVQGDIRDPFAMKTFVSDVKKVFHLAALIGIPYSYLAPASYVETNVQGTLNLLEAAKSAGIEAFLHTSTSEVYGSAQYVPIDEKHPLVGQSPYSASKIGADQLALSYFASFELPVITVRPFNTYGPRQSARAVIPTIITQIAQGKRKLKLGNISTTRDFNFVKDTVNGFLAAARAMQGFGEVFNIGSGFEISVKDTVVLIAEVMGCEVDIVQEEQRVRPVESEVERLLADNSKAQEVLGWCPEYGGREGFARGLKETAEWFMNKENLSRYREDYYYV